MARIVITVGNRWMDGFMKDTMLGESSRSECRFVVKKPFFGMAALALTGNKYCVIKLPATHIVASTVFEVPSSLVVQQGYAA